MAARSDVATERAEREAMNGNLNTLLARIAELHAGIDAEPAKLDAERERAAAAVVAHLALAERVAAERARPWWRPWAA